MGKKLPSWEKSYREDKKRAAKREKERERAAKRRKTESERKATKEKNERLRAIKKSARERARKEEAARKERERALKKATKEAEEADRIAEIELEVELFLEFTDRITGLHKKFKPNPNFLDHLREGKSANGRFFNKANKPEAKIFVPMGPDEVTRMLGAESKYTFAQYCRNIAKINNDLKVEIEQLEIEAFYTFDQFKDLNYPKLSIGRVLTARQKYYDYSLMKKHQLGLAKSKLAKLTLEYEEFKIKREKDYKERLLLHKQNEARRLKEINDDNQKIESEWIKTQNSIENLKKLRVEWVDKIVAGEEIAIQQLLSFLFPLKFDFLEEEHDYLISNPRDLDIAFCISDDRHMSLLIELEPDSDFYPDTGVKLSPSGKNLIEFAVKESEKKEKQKIIICSLALCYANFVFSYLEAVNYLTLEIVEPKPNAATGNYEDVVLLQLEVDRKTMISLNLDRVDPVVSVEHLGGKLKFSDKSAIIISKINDDELLGLDSDAYPLEIQDTEKLIEMNCILFHK